MNAPTRSRAVSLHTQRARRLTVAAAVVSTALLGSLLPGSLHGFGIVVVLVLAGLDVLLIQATAGLAFAPRRVLDERERELRDLAYRRGFRLLGVAAAVEVVLLIVTGILSFYLVPGGRAGLGITAVNSGITGRAILGLVELLLMAPTMVIAWVDRESGGEALGAARRRRRLTWFVLPALAGAWLVLVALAPEQTVTASANSEQASVQGAACTHFAAGRIIDAEFGASVGMRVEVCWNGHDAFVFGDSHIPLPPSAIAAMEAGVPAADRGSLPDPNAFNVSSPDLSGCGVDNSDDFATISSTSCTGVIDASGTLHYSVHAAVSGPLGIGRRDVTLTLVVDRTGNILRAP